jgi:hypothetical protein
MNPIFFVSAGKNFTMLIKPGKLFSCTQRHDDLSNAVPFSQFFLYTFKKNFYSLPC